MTTHLLIPEHVPSLNGKGGMLRAHWSKKKKIIDRYIWFFRSQTQNRHAGRVRLVVTRMCRRPLDYDNLVSCYKYHLDAIVRAGIITDDGPTVILESKYEQVRVGRDEQQQTTITITDCE